MDLGLLRIIAVILVVVAASTISFSIYYANTHPPSIWSYLESPTGECYEIYKGQLMRSVDLENCR